MTAGCTSLFLSSMLFGAFLSVTIKLKHLSVATDSTVLLLELFNMNWGLRDLCCLTSVETVAFHLASESSLMDGVLLKCHAACRCYVSTCSSDSQISLQIKRNHSWWTSPCSQNWVVIENHPELMFPLDVSFPNWGWRGKYLKTYRWGGKERKKLERVKNGVYKYLNKSATYLLMWLSAHPIHNSLAGSHLKEMCTQIHNTTPNISKCLPTG